MGIGVFEFLNQVLRKPLVFQLINGLRGQDRSFKLVKAKSRKQYDCVEFSLCDIGKLQSQSVV